MRIDQALRDLPGLAGWWSADYGVSLVGATNAVDRLLDRSGAGIPIFQATGALQPAYSVVNGKPRLTFTSTKYLNSTGGPSLLFPGTNRTIFAAGGGATLGGVVTRIAGAGGFCYAYANQTLITPGYIYTDASTSAAKFTGPLFTSQFVYTMSLTIGALPVFRQNGVAKTVVSHFGTGFFAETGTTPLNVTMGGPSNGFDGYINELIVCSGDVAAADIARVEAYLSSKWGGI